MPDAQQPGAISVAAMYRFADLESCSADLPAMQAALAEAMQSYQIRGTLILAGEGINGTVAGSPDGIDAFIGFVRTSPAFEGKLADLEVKFSRCAQPFGRAKVKIKNEIVTMRVEGVSPAKLVGTYVEPEDWNRLIDDPEVLVIDTRNDFEVRAGTFVSEGGVSATNPRTTAFCEFPAYVGEHLAADKQAKIAMFCTGGIRCEKATSYLRQLGYSNVFHLKGGILKYLEQVPKEDSRWQGECFVFDERVTVDHDLEPGSYELCRACREPISASDMNHPHYEPGVSCPGCFGSRTEADLAGLRERQRQIELAQRRGDQHIGARLP